MSTGLLIQNFCVESSMIGYYRVNNFSIHELGHVLIHGFVERYFFQVKGLYQHFSLLFSI